MEKEIWKDIKGYEDYYKISNLGRIKSIDRFEKKGKSIILKKGVILKQYIDKGGYLRITLHKNNIAKTFRVHRLVAQNFIDNPNDLEFVNHKDENKQNNNVNNLEWCTRKYNNNYGTRSLRAGLSCRKKIDQYDMHGNFIRSYESVFEAKKLNSKSSGTHISEVCNGKRKSAYGYIWKYSK